MSFLSHAVAEMLRIATCPQVAHCRGVMSNLRPFKLALILKGTCVWRGGGGGVCACPCSSLVLIHCSPTFRFRGSVTYL